MKNFIRIIVAGVIGPWLVCGNAAAAEIHVEVRGIVESKGEILVIIFNQAEGWMRKGVATSRVGAQFGAVTVTFANLAEGDYAVSAVHDLNSNGKLDSNLIGIPNEPFGFSNGATGKFGPPSYDQAKVRVDRAQTTIGIHLKGGSRAPG